jgi:hypothetical protein
MNCTRRTASRTIVTDRQIAAAAGLTVMPRKAKTRSSYSTPDTEGWFPISPIESGFFNGERVECSRGRMGSIECAACTNSPASADLAAGRSVRSEGSSQSGWAMQRRISPQSRFRLLPTPSFVSPMRSTFARPTPMPSNVSPWCKRSNTAKSLPDCDGSNPTPCPKRSTPHRCVHDRTAGTCAAHGETDVKNATGRVSGSVHLPVGKVHRFRIPARNASLYGSWRDMRRSGYSGVVAMRSPCPTCQAFRPSHRAPVTRSRKWRLYQSLPQPRRVLHGGE